MQMNLCISCFMYVNSSTLSRSNLICFGKYTQRDDYYNATKSFILPLSI